MYFYYIIRALYCLSLFLNMIYYDIAYIYLLSRYFSPYQNASTGHFFPTTGLFSYLQNKTIWTTFNSFILSFSVVCISFHRLPLFSIYLLQLHFCDIFFPICFPHSRSLFIYLKRRVSFGLTPVKTTLVFDYNATVF